MTPASLSAYDTLDEAANLKAAGIEPKHAEAIARSMLVAISAAQSKFATKSDIADLRAEIQKALADLHATMYRLVVIQTVAIIGILAALKFIP